MCVYFLYMLYVSKYFYRAYLYIEFMVEKSVDVTFMSLPLLKKSPVAVNKKINTSSFLADSFKSIVSSLYIYKKL